MNRKTPFQVHAALRLEILNRGHPQEYPAQIAIVHSERRPPELRSIRNQHLGTDDVLPAKPKHREEAWGSGTPGDGSTGLLLARSLHSSGGRTSGST